MVELTNAQCQKYQEEHWGTEWSFDNGIYYVHHRDSDVEIQGYTLESAFTAHRDKYHPTWTPPVAGTEPRSEEHDAEWALRYAKAKRLTLQFNEDRIGSVVSRGRGINPIVQRTSDENIATTILNWKLTHGSDTPEPTREETAMELLEKIVKADCIGLSALEVTINNASDYLHRKRIMEARGSEATCADDEGGSSDVDID